MVVATPTRPVVVVIGIGGVGLATARRLGCGRHLVVATRSQSTLTSALDALRDEGHSIEGHLVDIADRAQVAALARSAGNAGTIQTVIHTSGVSPVTATTDEVLRIDLLGCAHVIEEFRTVATTGTTAVCVSSMAAGMISLPSAVEHHLAAAPIDELLDPDGYDLRTLEAGPAYCVAKRANQLRVNGAAAAWGARGARINTVSPGVIATRMGHQELHGPTGERLRQQVEHSPLGRPGTPDDIAAAIEFLTGPRSAYVTGTNLLVDGGTTASRTTPWTSQSTNARPPS